MSDPVSNEIGLSEADLAHLRHAIAVASRAKLRGNHPFGAILVAPDGAVLLEGENDASSGDRTAHAERALMSRASRLYSAEYLAGCTMYTSAEPCAMCAGAVYWAGVGRVVFGLSERALGAIIGPHPENLTMDLPCRSVLGAGQRSIDVAGPALEDEARLDHLDFWVLPSSGPPSGIDDSSGHG
jgi:tRNA(Arg) A34 adenosine deaminase TadA